MLIHPQAVADNRDTLQDRIDQTIRRLELVNTSLLEAESDAAGARMLAFAEYIPSCTIHTAREMIVLQETRCRSRRAQEYVGKVDVDRGIGEPRRQEDYR